MKICVIGLGEIGGRTLSKMLDGESLTTRGFTYAGVDINPDKLKRELYPRYEVALLDKIPQDYDVYVVSVWNSQQVLETLKQIPWDTRPLVCIESTFDPGMIPFLKDIPGLDPDCMVAFPHRYNPNDAEHDVFNLTRVLGGMTPEATKRGYAFYLNFMNRRYIYQTTFGNAVTTKVLENAYRYMEIVIAQELKRTLEASGYNFAELRMLANSKWNIDIREAIGGVEGKCLPKDMGIFMGNFPNGLWNAMEILNKAYIEDAQNGKF